MKVTPYLAALALFLTVDSSAAVAQERAAASRVELTFDHAYGFGSEGDYVELGADFRAFGARGLGAVLRAGLATQLFSNAFALDVGFAYRLELVGEELGGLALGAAIGPSFAYGPFDAGDVGAYGGWAFLGLDFWHRRFVAGIGASAHVLVPGGHARAPDHPGGQAGRADPILTVAPTLRLGFGLGR